MLNQVQLIGNLGNDPEVKYLSGGDGNVVCRLRMATSRSWKDKDGNKHDETEWHDVEVWGKQAEACGKYLKKGSRVFAQGRIKTDSWEDKETKEKRYRQKIVADFVRFLDSKRDDDKPSAGRGEPPASEPDDGDPF